MPSKYVEAEALLKSTDAIFPEDEYGGRYDAETETIYPTIPMRQDDTDAYYEENFELLAMHAQNKLDLVDDRRVALRSAEMLCDQLELKKTIHMTVSPWAEEEAVRVVAWINAFTPNND